jgi:hypothetical protein
MLTLVLLLSISTANITLQPTLILSLSGGGQHSSGFRLVAAVPHGQPVFMRRMAAGPTWWPFNAVCGSYCFPTHCKMDPSSIIWVYCKLSNFFSWIIWLFPPLTKDSRPMIVVYFFFGPSNLHLSIRYIGTDSISIPYISYFS